MNHSTLNSTAEGADALANSHSTLGNNDLVTHMTTGMHDRLKQSGITSTIDKVPSMFMTRDQLQSAPESVHDTMAKPEPTRQPAMIRPSSHIVIPAYHSSPRHDIAKPGIVEAAGTSVVAGAAAGGALLSVAGVSAGALGTGLIAATMPGMLPNAIQSLATLTGYTVALPIATAVAGRYIGKRFGRPGTGAIVGGAGGLLAGHVAMLGGTAALAGLALPAAIGAGVGGAAYLGSKALKLFRN